MSPLSRFVQAGCGVLIFTLLQGCINLGPDYVRPDAEIQPDWIDIEGSQVSKDPLVDPRWWQEAFHDAVLDRLVETALQENLTLRSAGLRVLQSQQQLAIAIGNQFPQQQQVTGQATRQKSTGVIFNNYNLGFNLGWELDFWGRFRRLVESSSASLDASVASYDAALVSLVSQVSQNYILIRTFEERLAAARFNIKLQEESFRIAKAKFDAGEVSDLDVRQAETLLNNTRASVPELETSLQQLKNSLAILLGKPPHDMNSLLAESSGIPDAPPTIALGMPQDLLRRRPDVRLAERQLAAQSAQIGFAVTDLYPHLSIGGTIGSSALKTRDLFESDTEFWSLFGAFEWDVLNYGRLRSNVRLQDALFQQLLVDYRNQVLQAQGETENAIVAFLKSNQQLTWYRAASEASRRAVDVAVIQYQQGEIDFNTLITTLASNVNQDDLLAATRGSVATNLVQVYRALGGGWEIRDNRDPVELLPDSTKNEMRSRTGYWDGVFD
jgi:NodT family efflux transporter outer membrane factor (OMF) lipoprotein